MRDGAGALGNQVLSALFFLLLQSGPYSLNMRTANPTLVEFEQRHQLSAREVSRVLEIGYPTYAAYRNCSRVLPMYHVNQLCFLELIHTLCDTSFSTIIESKLK